VFAVVEDTRLRQRRHESQVFSRKAESDLFKRFAYCRFHGRFSGRQMAGRRDVPQSGIVFLSQRTALEEETTVRRDDPNMRRAMPVAVAMNLIFRLARAGRSSIRRENFDQLDHLSSSRATASLP